MNDLNTFAGLLLAWRGDRSAAECGRILGKSSQTILEWCRGASVPPRPSRPALAKLLDVTPEHLTSLIETQRTPTGIRIDTPDEARAWIAKQDPTPVEQGG
jgi:hypothetical protein